MTRQVEPLDDAVDGAADTLVALSCARLDGVTRAAAGRAGALAGLLVSAIRPSFKMCADS